MRRTTTWDPENLVLLTISAIACAVSIVMIGLTYTGQLDRLSPGDWETIAGWTLTAAGAAIVVSGACIALEAAKRGQRNPPLIFLALCIMLSGAAIAREAGFRLIIG